MKKYVCYAVILSTFISGCNTNCGMLTRSMPVLLRQSGSFLSNHPKALMAVGALTVGLIAYKVFSIEREKRIRAEKNMDVDMTRAGLLASDLYLGAVNSSCRTWGKCWSLHNTLVNNNGRAAWRFEDENGIFDEIVDTRHTYDEILREVRALAAGNNIAQEGRRPRVDIEEMD